jgi:hypothetical protein
VRITRRGWPELRLTALTSPRLFRGLLRNIALLIPLLVALIVGIIYWQKGRAREAEYTEFLTGAQNKFQQAQGSDPGTAYGLMAEAETLLVEAEKIKSGQPEITDLRQKIAEQTDTVGKVQRLYYLPQLRQYTDPGTNLKPSWCRRGTLCDGYRHGSYIPPPAGSYGRSSAA